MKREQGKVFIFSAPSGAGKTSIVHRVLARYPNMEFSVSATNRPLRGAEIDGKDYHFLSTEEFQRRIQAGEFLEWEEVYSGRYYGTLLAEVERITQAGNSAIFDVDVKGGINIKQHYGPGACAFFIQPPSIPELRKRLEARGTESPQEIDRRVGKAEKELQYASHFDYVIVNEYLDEAVEEVCKVIDQFLVTA